MQTETIRRRYDRNARFYDLFEGPMEWMALRRRRQELWTGLRGRVLEVGVGTGKNMPFYPPGAQVTGIDFSPRMLERARRRAERLGLAVDLRLMDAQKLDFPDGSFDAVVASCVFCSVPDPVLGFREIARVCRSGGQIRLLEHMRSEGGLLGPLMDRLNPLSVFLTGANINRRTVDNARRAGLQVLTVINVGAGDILKRIEAAPPSRA